LANTPPAAGDDVGQLDQHDRKAVAALEILTGDWSDPGPLPELPDGLKDRSIAELVRETRVLAEKRMLQMLNDPNLADDLRLEIETMMERPPGEEPAAELFDPAPRTEGEDES